MGLDMYAYCTEHSIPSTDFNHPEDAAEFAYWRKHPNLHGWMEKLYRAKGGAAESFNCTPVKLEAADLDALEQAVRSGTLPFTEGFFFGLSVPEDAADDLAFIAKAREQLRDGFYVFYDSWW